MIATLLFVLLVAVPDAEQLVGTPKSVPVEGAALERRTQEVASEIRCPVCQGLSIADSPSEMAVNMKGQVRALLARGYSEEQIEAYFERSYGQFALLRPKFEGVNVLVWILPVAALLAGVAIIVAKIRRLERRTPRAEPDPEPEEDPYLARVRELMKEEMR